MYSSFLHHHKNNILGAQNTFSYDEEKSQAVNKEEDNTQSRRIVVKKIKNISYLYYFSNKTNFHTPEYITLHKIIETYAMKDFLRKQQKKIYLQSCLLFYYESKAVIIIIIITT